MRQKEEEFFSLSRYWKSEKKSLVTVTSLQCTMPLYATLLLGCGRLTSATELFILDILEFHRLQSLKPIFSVSAQAHHDVPRKTISPNSLTRFEVYCFSAEFALFVCTRCQGCLSRHRKSVTQLRKMPAIVMHLGVEKQIWLRICEIFAFRQISRVTKKAPRFQLSSESVLSLFFFLFFCLIPENF